MSQVAYSCEHLTLCPPRQPVPGELAARLISGADLPAAAGLAPAYAIVVLEWVDEGSVAELFDLFGADDMLVVPTLAGAVVLLPLLPGNDSWTSDEIAMVLGGRAWCALTHRPVADVPSGHAEAVDVLAIVRAGRKEPGVYGMDDVLVEYAVARNDAVADRLLSLVRTLRANPTLFHTLTVLVRADYHRNAAAAELFIHRSTLDYRLGRIEEITGYHPLSRRGAQVFSLAMTMFALS